MYIKLRKFLKYQIIITLLSITSLSSVTASEVYYKIRNASVEIPSGGVKGLWGGKETNFSDFSIRLASGEIPPKEKLMASGAAMLKQIPSVIIPLKGKISTQFTRPGEVEPKAKQLASQEGRFALKSYAGKEQTLTIYLTCFIKQVGNEGRELISSTSADLSNLIQDISEGLEGKTLVVYLDNFDHGPDRPPSFEYTVRVEGEENQVKSGQANIYVP